MVINENLNLRIITSKLTNTRERAGKEDGKTKGRGEKEGKEHTVLAGFSGPEYLFHNFSKLIIFQATWTTTNLERITFTHFHPRYICTAGPWFYIFLQNKYPRKKEKIQKKFQITCVSKICICLIYRFVTCFLLRQLIWDSTFCSFKCLAPIYD